MFIFMDEIVSAYHILLSTMLAFALVVHVLDENYFVRSEIRSVCTCSTMVMLRKNVSNGRLMSYFWCYNALVQSRFC